MPNQVDRFAGASSSLAFKSPCRLAATSNITLLGYQTIDGVLPTSSDHEVLRRILVTGQSDAAENGIYLMSETAWVRTKDFDGSNDFIRGTRIYVWGGSAASGAYAVTTTITPTSFVVDEDDIAIGIVTAEIGAAGEDGDDGVNGADGVTPTFAIGTVTTVSSGLSATVALNSTSTNAYTFDFGIPKGADGVGAGTVTGVSAGFGMDFTTITSSGSVAVNAGFTNAVGGAI